MDANTNIDALRRKHKKMLVDRAMGLYQPANDTPAVKEEWVSFLLENNPIEEMIQQLKNKEKPDITDRSRKKTKPKHFSNGSLKLIDKDLECYASGRRGFLIEIKNHSPFVWNTSSEQQLFIAYHWYTEDGDIYKFDCKRTSLEKDILPGESLTCEMQVILPSTPGHYLLEPTMVLEGNFWMEEKELSVQRVPIKVEDYNGDGLTRHARNIYQALKHKALREKI